MQEKILMNMRKHRTLTKGRIKFLDFAKRAEIENHEVMEAAGKISNKHSSLPFHDQYIKINSKGKLFIIPEKHIGAWD